MEEEKDKEFHVSEEEEEESSSTDTCTSISEHSEENNSSVSEDSTSESEPEQEKITFKAKKDKRSGGSWKVCQEKNVFRSEWIGMYPWIDKDPDDVLLAVCRVCNKKMKAVKNILDCHQRTKRHLKNIGCPDEPEEIRKEEKQPDPRPGGFTTIEQLTDDQISFFTESPAEMAHQAVTSVIDKLVDKYHERRLENRKRENEVLLEVKALRTKMLRTESQQRLQEQLRKEAYKREIEETELKFMQIEHETKISAMESERDAKLKAVEQELLFAKQEYEKKVRLLDSQLSSMK